MLTDKDGNKATPKKVAIGIYLAFGDSWACGDVSETDIHSGYITSDATESELGMIHEQLNKTSKRVKKYLGV